MVLDINVVLCIVAVFGIVLSVLAKKMGGFGYSILAIICWLVLMFAIAPEFPLLYFLFLGLIMFSIIQIVELKKGE